MDSETNPRPERSPILYWGILLVIFALAVIVIFSQNNAFYQDFQNYFTNPPPPANASKVRVTIDFGNGQKRAFLGDAQTGMTIFAALVASGDVGNFFVATDERGRVTDIAGVGGEKQWRLYVNGSRLDDVPGNVEVRPGDKVEFRYE